MAQQGRGPEPVPVVVNSESRMYHLPEARHLAENRGPRPFRPLAGGAGGMRLPDLFS